MEETHTGGIKHNSEFLKPMDPETTKMLWGIMAENSNLKNELYMVNNQLESIKKILNNGI